MALTTYSLLPDLVARSPVFVNPLKDREIDLRGNKISVIENLGVTQDQFDTIDLSDNEIKKLDNFPLLRRLHTILLNNNRISRISPGLDECLPKLESLILTNNKLTLLADLEPLAELASIQYLSLLHNPVTQKQNYRLYVIHLLPKLRVLDFRKVKKKERDESIKLFGDPSNRPKQERRHVVSGEVAESVPASSTSEFSKDQAAAIKAAIEKSLTMDDLHRIENSLMAGQLPPDFANQGTESASVTSQFHPSDVQ